MRRVFEFDDSTTPGRNNELAALFSILDNYSSSPGVTEGRADLEEEKADIEKSLNAQITPEEWDLFTNQSLWPGLQKSS